MHVSIDMIVEELCAGGLDACVLRREERRGISTATTDINGALASTLLVTRDDGTRLPAETRHLLLVVPTGGTAREVEVPNLAVVRSDLTPPEVHGRVCNVLMSFANWDARLLEAVAIGQSVEAVLAIAAERLVNPLALFDSQYALLCYAGELPESADGTIWEDVLDKRYSPIEYYTRAEQARITKLIRRPWPFVLTPRRDPTHQNLSRAITVNGETIGSIGQVDVNGPFTPAQIALADMVADRLQLAMARRLGGGPGENDTSYLIRGILNGNKTDKALLAYHLSSLGWRENDRLVVAVFFQVGDGDEISEDARLSRIQHELPRSVCLAYEGRILALMPALRPDAERKLDALLPRIGLAMATSEPFCGVLEARVAYEQCLLVIESCADMEAVRTVSFSNAFERVVPHVLSSSFDARTMCDETIRELATTGYQGDLERGRMLVRELYAYLMNGCNTHLTARQLYLHRNTLSYQIEKIEQLLRGEKLDQLPSTRRLFLAVSCLVALDR